MKIIISPAKKMIVEREAFPVLSTPQLIPEAEILLKHLKSCTHDQLQKIWVASDKIVAEGQRQLEAFSFTDNLTPAVIAYQGIQYQYMAADVMTKPALQYLQDHVCILSGLYGVLRPFDGVSPYRLEVKNKLLGYKDSNLYHFWGDRAADLVFKDDDLVINLASKEYSKMVSPYVHGSRKMITIDFEERKAGQWKTVGVHAKMARGAMTQFLAETRVHDLDTLRTFNDFGFKYIPEASTETNYVFRTEHDFKRR